MEIKVNIIKTKIKFGVPKVWSAWSYLNFKYSELKALQTLLYGKFIIFAPVKRSRSLTE